MSSKREARPSTKRRGVGSQEVENADKFKKASKSTKETALEEVPSGQAEQAEPAELEKPRRKVKKRSKRAEIESDGVEPEPQLDSEQLEPDSQLGSEQLGPDTQPETQSGVGSPTPRKRKCTSRKTKPVKLELPERPAPEIELGSTLPDPPSEAMPSSPHIKVASPISSPVLGSPADSTPSSPVRAEAKPKFPDFMQSMLKDTTKPKFKRGPKEYRKGVECTIYEVAWGRGHHRKRTRKTMDELMIASGADFVPWSSHPEMPCDEIMQALLQYGEEFVARHPGMERTFDLSVLLGMAIMCEDEINEAIGPRGHLMYAQEKQPSLGESS